VAASIVVGRQGLVNQIIRDAPFVCISTLWEEHHESTDHDDTDGHDAAVLGGFFAGW
jgi:hypothetical protein